MKKILAIITGLMFTFTGLWPQALNTVEAPYIIADTAFQGPGSGITGFAPGLTTGDSAAVFSALASTAPGQGDALLGVLDPGVGSVATTQDEVNSRVVSVYRFLTSIQKTSAQSRVQMDMTGSIQAALTYLNSLGGGTLLCPSGSYWGNWMIPSRIKIKGDGMDATIFYPTINADVFGTAGLTVTAGSFIIGMQYVIVSTGTTSFTSIGAGSNSPGTIFIATGQGTGTGTATLSSAMSTVKISFEDLSIIGNPSFLGSNGIHLETTGLGNFVDSVFITRVLVRNNGSYGVYASGSGAAGPFVQRLKIDSSDIGGNNISNLVLRGTILSTEVDHCTLCETLTWNNGHGANELLGSGAGNYPQQVTFINCLSSNAGAKAASISGSNFVVGLYYIISSMGTSTQANWQSIGAPASNGVGTGFVATGTALTGTGAASPSAMCYRITGGDQLVWQTCDIEFGDPAIYTNDPTSNVRSLAFRDCNFGFVASTTDAIQPWSFSSLIIEGCHFGSAGVLTNVINFTISGSGPAQLSNFSIRKNVYSNVTNVLNDATSFYQNISSSSVVAYRDVLYCFPTGTLNTVNGVNGNNLIDYGQVITLRPFAGQTITVGSGLGNIFLNGGGSFAMSGNNSLSLRWDNKALAWFECGRS